MIEAILFITMCTTWDGEQICTDKYAATYSAITTCNKAAKFYNKAAGQSMFQCKKRELDKVPL
jgi:hypothetical protein